VTSAVTELARDVDAEFSKLPLSQSAKVAVVGADGQEEGTEPRDGGVGQVAVGAARDGRGASHGAASASGAGG
jgi:hypothetical protein